MDSKRAHEGARRMPARSRPMLTDEDMLNEGEYDDVWPVRLANSTRRYQGTSDVRHEAGRSADVQAPSGSRVAYRTTGERHTIPPRRTATQTRLPAITRLAGNEDEQMPVRATARGRAPARIGRPHWLFFMGIALCIMILGWVTLSAASTWWQTTLDDWHYGRPRTYQADAVVGHHDSAQNPSHFIAMNLNRHIIVIEIPGGNVAKSIIYTGPTLLGSGQDLTPVTLSFQDLNHDGKPDMIVNVQGSQFVFLNQNGTFVPTTSNSNPTG